MDEYDVLVRENVDKKLFNQYLDLLNGLFKSDTVRPAIALAYLTGILPVIRDKIQSKLNNFEECQRWYDGYSQRNFEIYNPESVVKSIMRNDFASYWSKTSSYEVITDRISANFEGTKDYVVRMLSGESAMQ